jgi:hypothetical protein
MAPIPLLEDPCQYYLPIHVKLFQVVSFLQVSPSKPCMPSSPPTQTCCMPHFILLDHPNTIWCGVQSSSLPCYLVPLKPKYLSQHPIKQVYNFTIDQYYIISHLFQEHVLFIHNLATEYNITYIIQYEKYIGTFLGI